MYSLASSSATKSNVYTSEVGGTMNPVQRTLKTSLPSPGTGAVRPHVKLITLSIRVSASSENSRMRKYDASQPLPVGVIRTDEVAVFVPVCVGVMEGVPAGVGSWRTSE